MNKLFDLRFVIGSFFLIVGIALLGYGFFSANGVNNSHTVDRWCGLVFIVFAILMIILSLKKEADDEI